MAKPSSGATINGGHALSTGLTACWPMLEGSGTTTADLTGNGHTLTFDGSGSKPTWTTNGGGEAMIAFGTALAAPLAVTSPITLSNSASWSIAFRGKQTADDNNGMVVGDNSVTTDFIWMAGGVDVIRFRNTANGDADFSNASFTTDANWLVTFDQPGGKVHAYKNGAEIGTGVPVLGDLVINTVGNGYTSNSLALVGALTYVYVWGARLLDATDAGTLDTNPYAFLTPGSTTILIDVAD